MDNMIFDVLEVYFTNFIANDVWNVLLIGAIAVIPFYLVIRLVRGE